MVDVQHAKKKSEPEQKLCGLIRRETINLGQTAEEEWWRTGTLLDGLLKNEPLRFLLNLKPDAVEAIKPLARAEEVFGEPCELSKILHVLAMTSYKSGWFRDKELKIDPDLELYARLARIADAEERKRRDL